jgi:Cu+-exporting ATPase
MPNVKDPVCGMIIESTTSAGTSTYEGQTYYFCSDECKRQFDKNPARYAEGAATSPAGRGRGM